MDVAQLRQALDEQLLLLLLVARHAADKVRFAAGSPPVHGLVTRRDLLKGFCFPQVAGVGRARTSAQGEAPLQCRMPPPAAHSTPASRARGP